MGEYFFRPLLAVARNDDEPRLNWCNRIQSCQTAIEEYKHGWDKIGCSSAVKKLWFWFSPEEQKVIRQYYKDNGGRYTSDQQILDGIKLRELIKTSVGVF